MADLYPPLPPDLVELAEAGVSVLVGTASADRVPDCVRGVGIRVWPGACRMTVLVPAATGRDSIANLRTNPRVAVTLSHVPSHRTLQVKGPVVAIRDGGDDEHALAIKYRALLAEELAFVGQPAANTQRLGIWPCYAIDFDIEQLFAQTPGPKAGLELTTATRGAL